MNKVVTTVFMGFMLITGSLQAGGTFKFEKGTLENTDKIDIIWRQQKGNCPTKYPTPSIDCTYRSQNMVGFIAQYIPKLNGQFTTQNTYFLKISLNAETQKKGYPFNAASCQNLQAKVKKGSLITINKTGCSIK